MDTLSGTFARFNRIELAHEPDFSVGHVLVRPSRCEFIAHGATQVLQRRVMQVLVALAQAEGEVISHDDLVTRCWAGLAVSADAIVRCIGKLRRLGADLPVKAFDIETVPGVGYRLIAAAPPPTPDATPGWSAHPASTPARSLLTVGGQKSIMAAATAAIALVLLAVQLFPTRPGSATRLVRVEPLDAAHDDREAQAISSGLGAALTRNLAGSNTPVEIVDGGARGAAIERPAAELDAFMDQVSVQIAHELHCASNDGWPRYFDSDPELARLALDHCDALGRDFDEMVRYSAQITQRAPGFARGWSTYALDTAVVAENLPPLLRDAGYAHAREYARHALAIDPHQAPAYAAIIQTMDIVPHWFERESLASKGIAAVSHSPEIHALRGNDFTEIGRLQDAVGEARTAYQYDHFVAANVEQLAITEATLGEIDRARDFLAQGRRLWPGHPWFDWVEFEIALYDGDPAVALKLLDERKVRYQPSRVQSFRAFLAWRKAPSASMNAAAVRAITSAAHEGPVSGEQVQLLAWLDRTDAAYQLADRLPASASNNVGWFRKGLAKFRADPRFMPLAARLGLAQIWLKSGLWPDFCGEKGIAYDCRTAARSAASADINIKGQSLGAVLIPNPGEADSRRGFPNC